MNACRNGLLPGMRTENTRKSLMLPGQILPGIQADDERECREAPARHDRWGDIAILNYAAYWFECFTKAIRVSVDKGAASGEVIIK